MSSPGPAVDMRRWAVPVMHSVEVTWETARDWIRDNSKESREELKRIKSERELREYLRDGTVLLRLLMHSTQQEIEGVKLG